MKADPKVDDPAPRKPSRKRRMTLIAAAVVLLGAGGGAAWYVTQGGTSDPAAAQSQAAAEPPVYLQLDQFTVNLQPEEGEQYLQVQFTLQAADLEQVERIKTNMPKVRNRVLLLLSGKKASEISTVEGKQLLSQEIIAAIKQPFVAKGQPQLVSDVLFTSFIIQ